MFLNLSDLCLRTGEHFEQTYFLDIAPVVQGGVDYQVLLHDGVTLDIERVVGGFLVNVTAEATVYGPCMRCLHETVFDVQVTQQEFAPSAKDGWPESELSAFIQGLIVDVAGLAREAVVLAVPQHVLCSPECRGLCPHCGHDLNQGPCLCEHEVIDVRWARLLELGLHEDREA
ncbi:MAG: DUF177 domain-containing protein [Thermoleophilia bacterium]|nr:DUF177 domain-containing protein [Thermoleophilia bacterium]